ncbi:MAG: response regulator [Lentimicrobium sp.]|jgi:CheY-like chemotaxis protein|nr:response regulator [Lentimicrobium sp.]
MLNTILCIDDDPITLMLCKMVITKASFSNEIATAKNGEEALKYFNTLKQTNSNSDFKKYPQLIFLDLNMPVMGGWEFLDSFSTADYSDYNDTKVIILSSTIDPEDLEKSKKYPMVIDFLSKPISKEMLEYLKDKI